MYLVEKVKDFPHQPGVYLMKDSEGKILYVGKAIDLRKRVASYLKEEGDGRHHVQFLMKRVVDIDYVLTDSEKEALLLENTFIKKHRPRYNIHLKDDKSYVSIKLTKHDFPRVTATRYIKKDGGSYFGPYTSAKSAYETVEFIEKHFRLRNCSDNEFANRVRPCLQHQIHRCDAPCVGLISKSGYEELVSQTKMLLKGHNHDLLKVLKKEMAGYAEKEEFEKAAAARDLVTSLEETLEKQKVEKHIWIDQDVVAFYREGDRMSWCVMMLRQGKVWESKIHFLKGLEEDEDVLESFLNQHYQERFIPDEILVPKDFSLRSALAQVLSEKKEKKVVIAVPQRGDKQDLMTLAWKNAHDAFQNRSHQEDERLESLGQLQETLNLKNFPHRMECFDISTLGGEYSVGSLVSFFDGEADKSHYKKFKIKNLYKIDGAYQPNDFMMMREMLGRRLKHSENEKWPKPDLIVIDGGKGQLNIVAEVMQELGVKDIDLISLAKEKKSVPSQTSGFASGSGSVGGLGGEVSEAFPRKEGAQDKVFVPGQKNPILLGKHSNLLHLLMRIRDEAHRFAITYNRKLRGKSFLKTS